MANSNRNAASSLRGDESKTNELNKTLDLIFFVTISVTEMEDELRKPTIDSLRRSLYIRAILS